MRAALHSPTLASYAGQFVWLDVNLDAPENQGFFAQNHAESIPAIFVFDPSGDLRTTWLGTADVKEIRSFLDAAAKPAGASGADPSLRVGQGLMRSGDYVGAAKAFNQAIADAGERWRERALAQELLVESLQLSDVAACAAMADESAPSMPRTRSFVTVVATGLACAEDSASHATREVVARLERFGTEAVHLDSAEEDDRNQLYLALITAREQAGDAAGRQQVAQQYVDYVDSLPVATTPELRAARDHERLRAASKVGDTAPVIPGLEASERALPDRYDASLRLGQAYLGAKRYADAAGAATRGLAKNPGAQDSTRLLLLRAQAEIGVGDVAAARRDLHAAKDAAQHISAQARRFMPGLGDEIAKQLAKLGEASP